ncbi:transposase [Phocaeicola vulgatus]|uniref:transposase n=2 Tax=Phocaeicola vulgatus TaxID=821 RepID=UPI0034A53730
MFSDYTDKDVVRVKLALWYNEIEEFGYDTFTTVANSIENHYERILNYFVNRRTNAAAEAFNAKIKAFRASFRGVVDKRFFLYRLAKVNPPKNYN